MGLSIPIPGPHVSVLCAPSLAFLILRCRFRVTNMNVDIFGSFQSLFTNCTLVGGCLVTVQGSEQRKTHRLLSQDNILPHLLITISPLLHPLLPYLQQDSWVHSQKPLEADYADPTEMAENREIWGEGSGWSPGTKECSGDFLCPWGRECTPEPKSQVREAMGDSIAPEGCAHGWGEVRAVGGGSKQLFLLKKSQR